MNQRAGQQMRMSFFPVVTDVAVISFGTDPGLNTARGWDNVTGVGTPNAQASADFFYAQ